MASEQAPLSSVADDLERSGRDQAVSIGEVLDAFQHRSLGVLLTLFGLLAALPIIGDIPGMSIVLGTLILIVVGESLVGRGTLWMPDFVRRREVGRDKFNRSLGKARPWVERVDRLLNPRLTALSAGHVNRGIIIAAAAILAVTFYPLAFVPFGVTAPALGVLALGHAQATAREGPDCTPIRGPVPTPIDIGSHRLRALHLAPELIPEAAPGRSRRAAYHPSIQRCGHAPRGRPAAGAA